ncbi:type II toxin-antitoxin system CcdA family antitoxin [Klebsiella huaxiensis]|uniref:type II toxin-antitoxin system CcdA family antitoxin n=1 Tax=Klebsiella huaxiensis TaxID=2153354 RepID=UPI003898FA23
MFWGVLPVWKYDKFERKKCYLESLLCKKICEKKGAPAGEASGWQWEHQHSIDTINQWVTENGSFSDFQRSF